MSKEIFASGGETVKVWNGEDMTILKEYNHHQESVNNVKWNSVNDHILSTSGKGGQIVLSRLNLNSSDPAEIISYFGEGEEQCCASYAYGNSNIVSGGACGDVLMYNIYSGKLTRKFAIGPKETINCIVLNEGDTKVIAGNTAGNVLLWNVEDGKYVGKMDESKHSAIRAMQWNYLKHDTVGSTGDSGSVSLWDVNKMVLIHEFAKAHSAPAMDLSFSPLNNLLMVSCGLDKRIILHDVKAKVEINVKKVNQPLTSVCLTQNGRNLIAGTFLGKIYKYDLRNDSKPLTVVKAYDSSVQCLTRQFSPSKRSIKSKQEAPEKFHNRASYNYTGNTVDDTQKTDVFKTPSESVENGRLKVRTNNASPAFITTPEMNGKSPAAKHSLLRQTLANSTFSSSRDSLGSYCEGVISPLRKDAFLASPVIKSTQSTPNILQNHTNISSIAANTSKHSNFHTPNTSSNSTKRDNIRKSSTPVTSNLQNINESVEALNQEFDYSQQSNKNDDHYNEDVPDACPVSQNSRSTVSTVIPANYVSIDTLNSALNAQSEVFMNAMKQQSESLLGAMQNFADDLQEKNVNSHNHHLLEVSKLMFKQQQKYKELLQQYSLNPVLLAENERLRLENENLQKYY